MTLLFDRIAKLLIQDADKPDEIITGLRIQFQVEKFFERTLNVGSMTVFNLRPDLRSRLVKRKASAESAPFTTITLIAGFEDKRGTIFRGNLVQGFSSREGPDWITRLEAITGFDQMASARGKESDSYDTITALALVEKLLGSQHLNAAPGAFRIDPVQRAKLATTILTGNAYSGNLLDELVRVLAQFGLKVNLDDAEVLVAKALSPINPLEEQVSPIVSPDTGLLGSPRMTPVGVQLQTLLNHEIRVMKLFRVSSETTRQNDLLGEETQTFTCTGLKHVGDTHADEFFSEVTGAWFPTSQFTGSKNTVPDLLPEATTQSEIPT